MKDLWTIPIVTRPSAIKQQWPATGSNTTANDLSELRPTTYRRRVNGYQSDMTEEDNFWQQVTSLFLFDSHRSIKLTAIFLHCYPAKTICLISVQP